MHAIFVTGTAGAGKSLLTSKLAQWYTDSGAHVGILNLDPGAVNIPYSPDVDVRDFIDINVLMENYALGPNGSLVMASDMIATKLDEIQEKVYEIDPEYIIVDTPGQIELFAFRASGPYFITNLNADSKATIFAFDGVLVSSPINYVSVSMLAASVKLRLKTAQVNVLTKRDLVIDKLKDIMDWSASSNALDYALNAEKDSEYSLLSRDFARSMGKGGFSQTLLPVSSVTMNGIMNLGAALSRILNQGEDTRN